MNQYFDESPDVPSDPKTVLFTFKEIDYVFETDRGVFSYERIDKATRILLDVFSEKYYGDQPEMIIDVGCGYGPITCVVADQFPQAHIIGVETNQRARDLAIKNCRKNIGGDRIRIMSPAEVDDTIMVDLIVSNPPIRIGKDALYELLRGWSTRLNEGGQMWIVMAKNLGSDSTAAYLESECGLAVHRVASKKGFRVLRCVK
ncbi:MAG TPA: methyltransferase [Acidimicrobiia bacterium]|mgnify:CR=1 FL=1|nr:methyltransferase [Acidimicrobiia bacterium]